MIGQKSNHMTKFSEKILDTLFRFLNIKDLRIVKRVNKTWYKSASQVEYEKWNTQGQIFVFNNLIIDVQEGQVIYSFDIPTLLLNLREQRHTEILTNVPYKFQV